MILIFFFSARLQNTITSCSTKKQLYWPITVHKVQRCTSHLIQDQLKAVIGLLPIRGSGRMLINVSLYQLRQSIYLQHQDTQIYRVQHTSNKLLPWLKNGKTNLLCF